MEKRKKELLLARVELAAFRLLGERNNHYATEADKSSFLDIFKTKVLTIED